MDFGLANYFDVGQEVGTKSLRTQCGSPHYAAPEILKGERYSGPLADIWSLGVLLYAMVCGSLPFNAPSIPLLIKKIVQGKFKLPRFLSAQAQHLIQSILHIAPENRPTLQDILNHPWCKKASPTVGAGAGAGVGADEAAAALEAEQAALAAMDFRRPLSRSEIISPQSYTNAKAQHLLQLRAEAMAHARRGYHTVNANNANDISSDRSSDDDEEVEEEDNAADEEGEEQDFVRHHDEQDDEAALLQARSVVRRGGPGGGGGADRQASGPGGSGAGAGGAAGGKHQTPSNDTSLPPSSALSFQPDSSHLLGASDSFGAGESPSASVSSSCAILTGPTKHASSASPRPIRAATAAAAVAATPNKDVNTASQAMPWGAAAAAAAAASSSSSSSSKKPISCTRCGKQLSVRTNGSSGAIVLAGTSLSQAAGVHLPKGDGGTGGADQAPVAGLDLCQCRVASPTAQHTVRAYSSEISSSSPERATPIQPALPSPDAASSTATAAGINPANAPAPGQDVAAGSPPSHNAQYFSALRAPREAHFASPTSSSSSSSSGGAGRSGSKTSSSTLSPPRLLTADELAARDAAYKANVTALFVAAERGDAAALAKLISPDSGAASPVALATAPNGSVAALLPTLSTLDVRVTTIDSWTALHFGARNGHERVVQLLLTCWQPLDINCRTKSGWTALMLAADKGHLGVANLLLKYGAAIHVTNNDGKSAIFLARESGHPAIAQALTHASSSRHRKHTEGASARNHTSIHPESGEQTKHLNHQLSQAAECGDLAKVKHLLQLGRSSSSSSSTSPTKEILAAIPAPRVGNESPTQQAPAAAAAAAAGGSRRSSGRTDSGADGSSGSVSAPRYCVDILARGIDNWSVLHFAARKGRGAVVGLLLEQDPAAEVNALTKNGWSPLMMAADRGHHETCARLIQAGADVNLVSNTNDSALSVALEGGHAAIVTLLRAAGASINNNARAASAASSSSSSSSSAHA